MVNLSRSPHPLRVVIGGPRALIGIMGQTKTFSRKIAIAGAGVIGLSCAFELAERGHRVTLFDPSGPEASTSWAAAGMIAPAYELMLQEGAPDEALSSLCFESAALWQDFAARIRRVAGLPLGYSRQPTVAVARTAEELRRLESLQDKLSVRGHPARQLAPADLSGTFGMSEGLVGGLLLADDHQVDNRRLLTVLRRALASQGAIFVRSAVESREDIAAHGQFDVVVWARGARETGIAATVKGQALSLSPVEGGPQQTVRFGSGYAVPKPDRIVIGATSERDYRSSAVEPRATDALLEAAIAVLPALRGAPVLERWAGLRPKGQDERPLIGQRGTDEFVAAAHYRNGVLLAPVTARLIAGMIEGTSLDNVHEAFGPDRSTPATA